MFNPFPDLLWLDILARTFLRLVVGIFFLSLAYKHMLHKPTEDIAQATIKNSWLIKALGMLELVTGICLILGFFTQPAALAGMILSSSFLHLRKSLSELLPHDKWTYIFLLVICFTLIFFGAGAIAFDIPM